MYNASLTATLDDVSVMSATVHTSLTTVHDPVTR